MFVFHISVNVPWLLWFLLDCFQLNIVLNASWELVQLMSFWLNYFICLIRICQYLIKEINTCSCDYAFDAEKQGVVQTLHQVSNQTDWPLEPETRVELFFILAFENFSKEVNKKLPFFFLNSSNVILYIKIFLDWTPLFNASSITCLPKLCSGFHYGVALLSGEPIFSLS